MSLISRSGLRPGFSLVCACAERRPPKSMHELLALGREHPVLQQPRGVRIGRILEHRVGPDDQRRALGRIDDLDRLALLLELEQDVFDAVRHDGALAERELLGRIGRRLHLHDPLLGELLEILPAEVARHLVGRGQDRAAVAGMRLDDLAGPFRIEQVGVALRRLLAPSPGWCCRRSGRGTRGSSRTARPGPCARPDSAWPRPPARRARASRRASTRSGGRRRTS